MWKLVFFLFVMCEYAPAADVEFVSTQLPPYVYQKDGVIQGAAAEIVMELQKKVNQVDPIVLFPWARAQLMVKDNAVPTLIFPLSRTPEREDKYQWLAPLLEDEVYVFAQLKSKHQKMEECKRIGVLQGAPGVGIAERRGLAKKVELANGEDLNLRKLMAGHIDCWVATSGMKAYLAEDLGFRPDQIRAVEKVLTIQFHLAGPENLNLIEKGKWEKAFGEFKKTSRYKEILKKYQIGGVKPPR